MNKFQSFSTSNVLHSADNLDFSSLAPAPSLCGIFIASELAQR